MVGWHHWLNRHEFEQNPGDGGGLGSLACCSPWGHNESDMTERLHNNKSWELVADLSQIMCPFSPPASLVARGGCSITESLSFNHCGLQAVMKQHLHPEKLWVFPANVKCIYAIFWVGQTLHYIIWKKNQINFLTIPILCFDKPITVTNIYIYS